MGVSAKGVIIAFCLAPVIVAAQAAEAPKEITPETARTEKKQIVSHNLPLTAQEAKRFWPVYEDYQKARQDLDERMRRLLADYALHQQDLSDEKAEQLVNDLMALDEERAKLPRSYLAKFTQVLPIKKVARYYQIERKLDALINYGVAVSVPIVK
ncbi:MAG TPA: hypothetical protein VKJ47_12690 [Candidatus Binatia bacterium]|nr:hypothetical protein [Candidatus Binatia bacterium]